MGIEGVKQKMSQVTFNINSYCNKGLRDEYDLSERIESLIEGIPVRHSCSNFSEEDIVSQKNKWNEINSDFDWSEVRKWRKMLTLTCFQSAIRHLIYLKCDEFITKPKCDKNCFSYYDTEYYVDYKSYPNRLKYLEKLESDFYSTLSCMDFIISEENVEELELENPQEKDPKASQVSRSFKSYFSNNLKNGGMYDFIIKRFTEIGYLDAKGKLVGGFYGATTKHAIILCWLIRNEYIELDGSKKDLRLAYKNDLGFRGEKSQFDTLIELFRLNNEKGKVKSNYESIRI